MPYKLVVVKDVVMKRIGGDVVRGVVVMVHGVVVVVRGVVVVVHGVVVAARGVVVVVHGVVVLLPFLLWRTVRRSHIPSARWVQSARP